MTRKDEPSTTGTVKQQRCAGCAAVSPTTETNYTLISPKHAWRMVVEVTEDGRKEPSWYCPKCWERRKRQARP